MIITDITLENFRNVENQTVSFSDGVNILYGSNAQGKTNLVEAVYYLACGKSFRGAKDRELTTFSKNSSRINANTSSGERQYNLEIRLDTSKPKEIYINRVKIQKMREFMGIFRAVLFTPEHLSLIKGSPSERRSFADSAICQIKPAYISLLFEYYKVLEQRNALLKRYRAEGSDGNDGLLEYWNIKLASDAAQIVKERREYIKNLNTHAKEFYSAFCSGKEALDIKYSGTPEEYTSQSEIQDFIIKKLEENLVSDIKNGATSCGPHRDDLNVEIDTKPARLYASQGQQRSSILSMKLAEGEISHNVTGEYPVFLFDDILSELDLDRQNYILREIHSKQVFITGCIDYLFSSVKNASKIYVEKGVYHNRDIPSCGQ